VAVFPVDEAARIAALNRYAILDTPPEQKFDRITRMVSDICEAPIALISLIDSERQWFKSHLGMDATETPRDIAFCDHTIREDNLFIVPDASADLWPFGALPARRFRKKIGGAEEDRTPDLSVANAALSQLSYGPTVSTHGNESSEAERGG
jgi:hypothetical protein